MIQGVHASSVVFEDFSAVSGDPVAKLNRRLPGIDAAGYPVQLRGVDFKVRLGPTRKEKRVVVIPLILESSRSPFQPQLMGLLMLWEDTGSRTKIGFEGKCSRTFDGLSSTASTEAVRHHANEFCRTLLDVLVTAIEGSPSDPGARAEATKSSTSGRRPVARHESKAAIKGSS